MQARELLNLLTVAERLKDTTRHCYTSKGDGKVLRNTAG